MHIFFFVENVYYVWKFGICVQTTPSRHLSICMGNYFIITKKERQTELAAFAAIVIFQEKIAAILKSDSYSVTINIKKWTKDQQLNKN